MVKIITSSADVLDLGINSSQNNLLITKDAQSALQLIEYFDGDPNFILLENSELLPYYGHLAQSMPSMIILMVAL